MTNKIKELLDDWSLLFMVLIFIGGYWEIKQIEYDVQYTKDRVIALEDKFDKKK